MVLVFLAVGGYLAIVSVDLSLANGDSSAVDAPRLECDAARWNVAQDLRRSLGQQLREAAYRQKEDGRYCAVAPLRRCAVAPLRRCAVAECNSIIIQSWMSFYFSAQGKVKLVYIRRLKVCLNMDCVPEMFRWN